MQSMPRPERRSPRLRATALLVLAVAAGCGGRAPAQQEPQPTLRAAAIPYLPSSVRELSADDVAPPLTLAALGRDLTRWGFRAGSERTFQGQSQRLRIVVSRTLRFDRRAG